MTIINLDKGYISAMFFLMAIFILCPAFPFIIDLGPSKTGRFLSIFPLAFWGIGIGVIIGNAAYLSSSP